MTSVRSHARFFNSRVAFLLGMVLMVTLGACTQEHQQSSRFGSGPPYTASDGDFSLPTAYTVTIRYFNKTTALRLVDTMTRRFPGHQGTELLESNGTFSVYEYVSRARSTALDRWFTQALLNEGLSENAFAILFSDTDIRIEKL